MLTEANPTFWPVVILVVWCHYDILLTGINSWCLLFLYISLLLGASLGWSWTMFSEHWTYQWMHCSHVGPHLGTRVPMGTFFRFWVPIGSPFFFKVPIFSNSGLRTRENSVQPPSNVDHLIIQCKWHKHCALNEDTLCLCEYFFVKRKTRFFNELACFGQFWNIRFLGPHFCCRGSPFGPHFTQNWVPIRSPLKKF